jgi:hypothetical protein
MQPPAIYDVLAQLRALGLRGAEIWDIEDSVVTSPPYSVERNVEALLDFPVQAGVGTVGSQSAGQKLKQTSASFPRAFSPAPLVLATAQGGPYSDTFATTTRDIGTTGFDVNDYRVDFGNSGWGQNLMLGWMAFQPLVRPHTQSGRATVGSQSGTALKGIGVTFPQAFAGTPHVLLTAHGGNYPDTFVVTTTSITPSGFTANVMRTDYNGGWGQSLQLDWMAFDTLDDLTAAYQAQGGTADVGAQSNGTSYKSIPLSFPQAFSAPPTVLLTARGGSYVDTFAVTATQVTATGLQANVVRWDYPSNWGQDLHLDWIALPPTTSP